MSNINPKNPFRIICLICNGNDVKLELTLFNNGKPRAIGECRTCGRKNDLNHNLNNDEFYMPFGKYKGKTISEIAKVDINYAHWASKNLTDQLKQRFNQAIGTED